MGRRSEAGGGPIRYLVATCRACGRVLSSLVGNITVAVIAFLVMATSSAPAQDLGSSVLGGLLQQVQQMQPGGNSIPQTSNQPQTQTIQAPVIATAPSPPSRLELIFSDRAGLPMHQFGYSLFNGLNQITVSQVGSIQGYYVLGPGDQLQINLRGQENSTYTVVVDNDGNVILPKLSPIHAAGLTFSEFQAALSAAVKQAFISTTAFASVGQMRRISVTVAGEVNAPGVKMVTSLSSPLDALILALGVKKTGSLRDIRILRGDETLHYDLYGVLINGGGERTIRLADGDRIVVPPVGKVVAVSGWVRRPAIYELPAGQSRISLDRLLKLGGGLQVNGTFRYSLLGTDSSGRTSLVSLPSRAGKSAGDGDILFVERAVDEKVGQFEFFGPTSLAGEYSLTRYHSLADLIRAPGAMGQSPYMILGVISRKNPKTLQRALITFSPQEILAGRTDIALQSEDIVRIFDRAEGAMLSNAVDAFTNRIDYLRVASQSSQEAGATQGTIPGAGPQSASGQSGTTAASDNAAQAVSSAQDAALRAAISANLKNSSANVPLNAAIGYQPPSADMAAAANAPLQYSLPSVNGSAPSLSGTPQAQTSTPQAYAPMPGQQQMPLPSDQRLQTATSGPFVLDQRVSSQGNAPITSEAPDVAGLGLQIGVDPAVVISVLADHRVSVLGPVRAAGIYISGGTNSLEDLVNAAGGLQEWADMSRVEVTRTVVDQRTGHAKTTNASLDLAHQSMASIQSMPRDVFRFNPIYTDVGLGSVVVQGEVRYPGSYDLVRGERLSDLLRQAGGLASEAYPYGAVFLRKSIAQAQQAGFARAADDMEKQLAVAVAQASSSSSSGGQSGFSADTGTFLLGLVSRLRSSTAAGRVTVIADPATLAANPGADITLQPGDFLYIPDRPSSVTVVGEVLNQGSYTVRPSLSVDDYIRLAGGYGRYSDDGYTFVIYPDGTTRRAESSFFGFDSPSVPPGSVIVVPRDLTPFNLQAVASDLSKVFANLAVSAASLSVISKK